MATGCQCISHPKNSTSKDAVFSLSVNVFPQSPSFPMSADSIFASSSTKELMKLTLRIDAVHFSYKSKKKKDTIDVRMKGSNLEKEKVQVSTHPSR